MTEEMSPQVLLTATGFAAGEALAVLRKTQHRDRGILSPSQHWSVPQTREEIDHDRGPVLVKIEYRIDPKNSAAFVRAWTNSGRASPRWPVRLGNLRGRR